MPSGRQSRALVEQKTETPMDRKYPPLKRQGPADIVVLDEQNGEPVNRSIINIYGSGPDPIQRRQEPGKKK
jgi:hypothetical protein